MKYYIILYPEFWKKRPMLRFQYNVYEKKYDKNRARKLDRELMLPDDTQQSQSLYITRDNNHVIIIIRKGSELKIAPSNSRVFGC